MKVVSESQIGLWVLPTGSHDNSVKGPGSWTSDYIVFWVQTKPPTSSCWSALIIAQEMAGKSTFLNISPETTSSTSPHVSFRMHSIEDKKCPLL